MLKIKWTLSAFEDLEAIAAYIAQDKPGAAKRTVLKIRKALQALAWQPYMGREGRVQGTRELLIAGTPYTAAYAIKPEGIDILTIIHGARRYPEAISQ